MMTRIISFFFFFVCLCYGARAQQQFSGRVVDSYGLPVPSVSVEFLPAGTVVQTDSGGNFSADVEKADKVKFTALGYRTKLLNNITGGSLGDIVLETQETALQEVVVSTGYYKLNRASLTGSFTHIDEELMQRNPAPNIIDRLEGISSGLQFDRNLDFGETRMSPSLRVRGVGSLESSTQPLIVLDNFPYEGDINAINPNDIESVTILKDAAAAAIWGAKAGNGVIVITTKRGRAGERIQWNFGSNLSVSDRPNLWYDRQFLASPDMMEIEEHLYGKGNYYLLDGMYLPDYPALLFQRDAGSISDADFRRKKDRLSGQDIRREAHAHLYRNATGQRHNLSLQGGSLHHSFRSSMSWDRDRHAIIGNGDQRLTVNLSNDMRVGRALTLQSEIRYSHLAATGGGYGIAQLNAGQAAVSPYTSIFTDDGGLASVNYQYNHTYARSAEDNGLLDWTFNPVADRDQRNLNRSSGNLLMDAGLNWGILPGISVDIKYRYQSKTDRIENLYDAESYFARNLVNQYTQTDGRRVVPLGGVKDGRIDGQTMHNGRVQLNISRQWTAAHQLNAVAGSEVSQNRAVGGYAHRLYGFSADNLTYVAQLDHDNMFMLRPNGMARIPTAPFRESSVTDRFISHFANVSYLWKQRHAVSASLRWDASNIFGVKTNQRGVPLWSVGMSEQLKPYFGSTADWLSVLTLRATYGFSGNVNNTISSYPTIRRENLDFISGLPYALLTSAGNPSLRWEKLSTANFGLDYALFGNRINGSVEYYRKHGQDLIGPNFLDPTTGIIPEQGRYVIDNRINYADISTRGIDVVLNARPFARPSFRWDIDLLWSWTENTVTQFMANETVDVGAFVAHPQPREGFSRDALYAYPFAGISGENGQIITPAGDQNYMDYYMGAQLEDLMYMGVGFPPYQGGLRNTVGYKGVELSANMEWKNGFHFRRNSIDYFRLFFNGLAHRDYQDRWRQEGDENMTDVPGLPESADFFREALYTNSAVLIDRGNFLRLSDINLSYTLPGAKMKGMRLRTFLYLRNVGILYRHNKHGIDPEAVASSYPMPRTYTLGFQLEW